MRTLIIILTILLLTSCSQKQNRTDKTIGLDQTSIILNDCFEGIDTTKTGDSKGCSGCFIYKTIDEKKYLVVQINTEKVELTSTCMTFDLQKDKDKVSVWVDYFDTDSSYATNYCTDMIFVNLAKPKTYFADKGTVTCSLTKGLNVKVVSLTLTDKKTKERMTIDFELFYNVDVSERPG